MSLLWPTRGGGGLEEFTSHPISPPKPTRTSPRPARPQSALVDTATTTTQARELWRACVELGGGPLDNLAHTYLAGRLAWPPQSLGLTLPATVGWIEREDWPQALYRLQPPAGAAGAVVFAITDASDTVQAVQIEALTDQGKRLRKRWRRTLGPYKGGHFRADSFNPSGILLVEGPVSALAARWLWPHYAAWATCGTAHMKAPDVVPLAGLGLPVRIAADNDSEGLEAARAAWIALNNAGVAVSMPKSRDSGDAADWLAAKIRQQEGKTPSQQWTGFISNGEATNGRYGAAASSGR